MRSPPLEIVSVLIIKQMGENRKKKTWEAFGLTGFDRKRIILCSAVSGQRKKSLRVSKYGRQLFFFLVVEWIYQL